MSEQGKVDLKLYNEKQKLVVLIENKTLSGESDRQLARYWEDAENSHPDFAIGGIFLTPNGRPPKTAGKYDYVRVSYGTIAQLLDKSVENREVIDSGATLVRQYASAIRRWFVDDPELKRIAWRIYRQYPQAAMYLASPEARPDQQILREIKELVDLSSQLSVIPSDPAEKEAEVWFIRKEWEDVSELTHAGTAKAQGRLVIMWVGYHPTHARDSLRGVTLWLSSVPGAQPNDVDKLVESVRRAGLKSPPSLQTPWPDDGWTHAWGCILASEDDAKSPNRDQLFRQIEERWQRFLDDDLPKIKSAISDLSFQKP